MIKDISKIQAIYPVNEWEITEDKFDIQNNYRNETIFSIANGYIGMRGTFEEVPQIPKGLGLEGTFVNGFYESEEIKYGELAYAYAKKSQTMLNITNGKIIKLEINGCKFSMLDGVLDEYRRSLSLKDGCLIRELKWTSPKGDKVNLKITRIVSLVNKYISAIKYEISPVNFSGEIKLFSELDGDVYNSTTECNARIDYGPYGRALLTEKSVLSEDSAYLLQHTQNTQIYLVAGMKNSINCSSSYTTTSYSSEFLAGIEYKVNAQMGEVITLEKYITYVTSREFNKAELQSKAEEILNDANAIGINNLISKQRAYLDDFWNNSDIEIIGDLALQQGIRFNMFQLLQSAGRDGLTSLGAKGLSGEGYEGHYFWDTEMYALPFFIFNSPKIARSLLEYRYNTLDKARERAREMSIESGALFPWRTINGEEASAYYPAGTAQVHINADIAFAVQKYIDATGDAEFVEKFGAEILIETARFWVNYGSYLESKGGKFCINGVTGPDEFAVLVNNNAYTNMLARENLYNACNAVARLKKQANESFERLSEKINLEESELIEWKKAADNMYIPFDETKKIYPQDDSFLFKKPWDIKNTPDEKFPLLNNHHPLVVYRHQVSKQADLILGLCILSHLFDKEDIKRNFDFYETVTVHESSLSACIFSIVANNIGYFDTAYSYFMRTSRLDLDDYHRDTKAGIHCANMAGTWMSIVNGFAGMKMYGNELAFDPHLPKNWEGFSFKINYRSSVLKVTINKSETIYELVSGDEITVSHRGSTILVKSKVVC